MHDITHIITLRISIACTIRLTKLQSPTSLRVDSTNGGWLSWPMQESENIQCPFCGQTFELAVDTTLAEQQFTVDCEICCRPMEILLHCEDGEVLDLEVRGD